MIDKHRKGIRAELIAHEYFVNKNYRVFPALHNNGPIDFVTLDWDNKIRFFDVKTNSFRSNGTKICRTNNKIPGVNIEILYVDLDTKEVKEHTYDINNWYNKFKPNRDKKGKFKRKALIK